MRVRSLKFSVIGTGLIGGSLLRRLIDTGTDVIGCDIDETTANLAAERSIPFTDDLQAAVVDRDVVFLAAPLSALPDVLDRIAPFVGSDTIVTDVGSTKSGIAATAAAGPLAGNFIGGHPMAGSEKSGLTAADPHLFDGATWVLCPGAGAMLKSIRRLITVITTIFDAHVTVMTPAEHDEIVALSSHIPHLLAGTLAGAAGAGELEDAVLGLAAGSFRDGTRVAATAPERTVDMLVHNADAVTLQLTGVQSLLTDMADAVAARDFGRLMELFTAARQVRNHLTDHERRPAIREFSDSDAEWAFLAGTGRRRACVTGCTVDDQRTIYSTLE